MVTCQEALNWRDDRQNLQAWLDKLQQEFPENLGGWQIQEKHGQYRIFCEGSYPVVDFPVSYKLLDFLLDTIYKTWVCENKTNTVARGAD